MALDQSLASIIKVKPPYSKMPLFHILNLLLDLLFTEIYIALSLKKHPKGKPG